MFISINTKNELNSEEKKILLKIADINNFLFIEKNLNTDFKSNYFLFEDNIFDLLINSNENKLFFHYSEKYSIFKKAHINIFIFEYKNEFIFDDIKALNLYDFIFVK